MRNRSLLFFFLFLPLLNNAQTELGGVINRYAKVVSVGACAGQLEVQSTEGLAAGQAVLLIQIKGAELRIEESPAFGDILDPGAAGRYERGRIAAVDGNTVTLENALVHTYDPGGALQLVSIPEYEDATITALLTAQPWDGETGGILALEVRGTLRLEADINVSEQGFRGGISDVIQENDCGFLKNITDYGVDRTNWRGAPKGEGIGVTVNKENARGPQGNGGGGGNDHNSGGGGGANVTAGGQGGENREPSLFGCDGPNPGLGGKPAPTDPVRVYFGGGGGAGHENNDVGSSGGNGGGVIFLLANTIEGNDYRIQANGGTPPTTSGDGAGGGGAGGTILLQAGQINGPLTVQAAGGDGGSIDNRNQERCFGPGGGGSGGRVLTNQAGALTIDLSPGNPGLSRNSASCPESPNGARPGAEGVTGSFPAIPEGTVPAAPPAIVQQPGDQQVCSGEALTLAVEVEGSEAGFQWEIDRGTGFTALQEGAPYLGVESNHLTITSVDAGQSGYRYRLRLSSDCFEDRLSDPIQIEVGAAPEAAFGIDQNGPTIQLDNRSVNAQTYEWDFGDGNSSNEAEPVHTFDGSGRYVITLKATGVCGADTTQQVVEVILAPVVAFDASPGEGCAPLVVQFQNSTLGASSYRWQFPGGEPATSTGAEPSVRYASAGSYDVQLIAGNEFGSDTLLLTALVQVNPSPIAAFAPEVSGLTAHFQNNSTGADRHVWDFGDGNGSSQSSPTHTYATAGQYTVVLTVENGCGRDTSSRLVQAGSAPEAAFRLDAANGCTPHIVRFTNTSSGTFDRYEWSFAGGEPASSTDANPEVRYQEPGDYDVTLIVRGALGSDTLTQTGVVQVRAFPGPDFQYELQGAGVVAFNNLSTGAETYSWNFGDGATSRQENPIHTYAGSGVYEVTLNAQNGSCASAVSKTLVVMLTGTADVGLPASLHLFPNPAKDVLWITAEDPRLLPLDGALYSAAGQRVLQTTINGNRPIDLGSLPAGLYLLVLESPKGTWVAKVSLQ